MPLLCSLAAATAAIGALVMPFPAQQHAPPPGPVPEPAYVHDEPAADDADDDAPGFGPAARPAQLESARGGTGTTTHNNMNVNGTVTGNTATNVITGANTISAGAFTDASGIPMVIQNTGSNVLIQNATIINLRVQ